MLALAIPHTPWVPARVESLNRLTSQLFPLPEQTCIFSEQEPNWSWSLKVWEWGAESGADHLVQLQDDVIACPKFWDILNAMITAVPDQMIGLQGSHFAFRSLAREDVRWARSRAWMVGVGYVVPRAILEELVAFRKGLPEIIAKAINEDDLMSRFAVETKREIWHPIPTIIDHDTEIESTYNNDNHQFRRPTVTWREYGPNELTTPEFWKPSGEPPLIANPHMALCWFCHSEPGIAASAPTGARIGKECASKTVSALLKRVS